MRRPSPRAIAHVVIGALAVGALTVHLPRPKQVAPFAQLSIVADAPTDSARADTRQRVDTLRTGETLSALFARGGVSGEELSDLLRAASGVDERRVSPGLAVTIRSRGADSEPSDVILKLAIDRLLHLHHSDSGWTAREERLPWKTDTVVIAGSIHSSLYAALDAAAAQLPRTARAELAWALADIYEYRVDMSRELQPNDAFRVLFERQAGPEGVVRIGKVLAARFVLSGSSVEAVRFVTLGDHDEYFDGTGRSMRSAFLRAPVEFRRVSSGFGLRLHPILGIWRQHAGTDYVASSGTPVRAIGDGTIVFAGRKGGYGNLIELRHRNGFVSRYGHLRAFASGVRAGTTVSIGQTIGFVGMTGLATAPHLHFEMLVNGRQRDPRATLGRVDSEPVPAPLRTRFDAARTMLLATLDGAPGTYAVGP